MFDNLAKVVIRESVVGLSFWMPKERRIRLERWLRGREEFRRLQRADAVVVSYGKSGRTWLRVMLSRFYQVKHGIAEKHMIGFDNFHRMNPAAPKLLFTHDNYLKDYTGHGGDKRDYYDSRVVLMVRDPADTAVSQYFQWKFRMRKGKKALNKYPEHGSEVEIFDFVMDPDAGIPKIVDYMNAWATEIPRIREVLLIRYEELRADTPGALRRVVDFLGTPGDDKEIGEAVSYASVENMRKLEEKGTFWRAGGRMKPGQKDNPNSFKVRRAKVGGYRDYFDDAQVAAIETYLRENLSPVFGYGLETPLAERQPRQAANG